MEEQAAMNNEIERIEELLHDAELRLVGVQGEIQAYKRIIAMLEPKSVVIEEVIKMTEEEYKDWLKNEEYKMKAQGLAVR